jgi:hypothetical protein
MTDFSCRRLLYVVTRLCALLNAVSLHKVRVATASGPCWHFVLFEESSFADVFGKKRERERHADIFG